MVELTRLTARLKQLANYDGANTLIELHTLSYIAGGVTSCHNSATTSS
jgi:hypothetical protein